MRRLPTTKPQYFPTPGLAVGTIADTVQCYTYDRILDALLGNGRRDVRMVMLDWYGWHAKPACHRGSKSATVEIRVNVMCQCNRGTPRAVA